MPPAAISVKSYIWQTMGDERVRESHRAHDGRTYQWAKPPADHRAPWPRHPLQVLRRSVLPEMTEAEVRLHSL